MRAVPAVIPPTSVVDLRVVASSSSAEDPEEGCVNAGADASVAAAWDGFVRRRRRQAEGSAAPAAQAAPRTAPRTAPPSPPSTPRPVWGSPRPLIHPPSDAAADAAAARPVGAVARSPVATCGNFGGWAAPASLARSAVTPGRPETLTVSVDVDGKPGLELGVGDTLRISLAKHPLVTAAATSSLSDWLDDITAVLNWNLQPNRRLAVPEPPAPRA